MSTKESSPNPREIIIGYPWDVPEKLSGPAVMFDIVAASFNMIYLVEHAQEVYVVTKNSVRKALDDLPDALLIGEIDDLSLYEKLKDKFIASNSPTEITQIDVTNQKIILITNNGTHTLHELVEKGTYPVIVGHYSNIHALTQWLIHHTDNQNSITLVPSGGREQSYRSDPNLKEDLYCAQAVKDILEERQPDFEKIRNDSLTSIEQQYQMSGIPRQSTLDILFNSLDISKTVPICHQLPNGMLQLVNI